MAREGLESKGYLAHHIAQEHSYSPEMWKKIVNPNILIFLDVTYQETLERSDMKWEEKEYETQQQRLANAKENAHLYILTDDFSEAEVLEKMLEFLETE